LAKGTGRLITASGTGTVTITSDYATKDTAHTLITGSVTGSTITNAVVAGAGVGVGDTLTLGGVTYSFGFANTAAVSGTTKVVIGNTASTGNATATNFAAAINANNSAVLTNISASAAGAVVSLTSQNKGAQGTLDVVDTVSVPTGVSFGNALGGAAGSSAANTVHGMISLTSDTSYSVGGNSPSKAGLQNASSTLNTISTVDISTVTGANNAISLIDGALSQVATIRGSMGALQNRFSSVVSSLTASSENLSAARSRIQDADFAAETAALTRNQILQQAGIAMLAQANALPNQVLTLLRG
jgi:flagellin